MKITGHYSSDYGSRHEELEINLELNMEDFREMTEKTLSINVTEDDVKLFKQFIARINGILDGHNDFTRRCGR